MSSRIVGDAGPRPLQGAGHRGDGQLEDRGGLGGRVTLDVPQQQHRPLPRGQQLDHRQVRQLDRLAADRRPLGPGRLRLVKQRVGTRLQPRHVRDRRELLRPPLRRAQHVEARRGHDAVQPGSRAGAAVERGPALPGAQQRLLHRVLGLLQVAEHAVAVHLELAPVACAELREPGLVKHGHTAAPVRPRGRRRRRRRAAPGCRSWSSPAWPARRHWPGPGSDHRSARSAEPGRPARTARSGP
jgi:hypothetical protein